MDLEKLEKDAYRYAIRNAHTHAGKADLKAVIGKVLALDKDVDLKIAMPILQKAVQKVNSLGTEIIEQEYEKFSGEGGGYELKPKDKVEGLKRTYRGRG